MCVVFFPQLLPVCEGDTAATLMLSRAVFWSLITESRTDGWFYHYSNQWRRETGLTWKQQRRARQILKEIGLLEEDAEYVRTTIKDQHRRISRVLRFRVNFDQVAIGLYATGYDKDFDEVQYDDCDEGHGED